MRLVEKKKKSKENVLLNLLEKDEALCAEVCQCT